MSKNIANGPQIHHISIVEKNVGMHDTWAAINQNLNANPSYSAPLVHSKNNNTYSKSQNQSQQLRSKSERKDTSGSSL